MDSNNYFYVYDRAMTKYLRYEKGINFICTGLNVKTNDQFWQFPKSEALYQAVNEFIQEKEK